MQGCLLEGTNKRDASHGVLYIIAGQGPCKAPPRDLTKQYPLGNALTVRQVDYMVLVITSRGLFVLNLTISAYSTRDPVIVNAYLETNRA